MREFKIQPGAPPLHIRAMVVGLPSSGKTTFAGTCPRPLVISDAIEGGWKTLQTMDPSLYWDPNYPPDVWEIERAMSNGKGPGDVLLMLNKLEAAAHTGHFENGQPFPRTLIVDPISIYTDRMLSELKQADPGSDGRQIYGALADHLKILVMRFHALPCHVLWLCHTTQAGGLAISGQMAEKFPAFSDFKWMTYVDSMTAPNAPPSFQLHTKPFRQWNILGGRFDLPSPIIPSFKVISQLLRLPEQPVSPAVPGYPTGVVYDWPPQKTA